MPRPLSLAFALLIALCLCASARGDVVVTKDGRTIEGKILREDSQSLRIKTAHGEVELRRSEVVSITKGKSTAEELADKLAAAKSAEDFFQVGTWAQGRKLKNDARKAFERAVRLDGNHRGAHEALGHVQYKGRWMTVEERDRQALADDEAEKRAQGLVKHGERWVTPEEKQNLEQGLVEHQGEWITFEEFQARQGLELFDGRWIPGYEALARREARACAEVIGAEVQIALTADAAIIGPYQVEQLARIGKSLDAGRAWFDRVYGSPPGLALLGDRLAEFYCFRRDPAPYQKSVPHFAARTRFLPPNWIQDTQQVHGFWFCDPYALSSIRVWERPEEDLIGHSLHHWGHLLANRSEFDGRMLPPWFDESFAALAEYTIRKQNAVYCRAPLIVIDAEDTSAGQVLGSYDFDPRLLRSGRWAEVVRGALAAQRVQPFDRLARRQFHELGQLDVAIGMAILSWLEAQGDGAIGRFASEIKQHQPIAPERVVTVQKERQEIYDAAFRSACGMSWRAADQEWRTWLTSR